jgi:peptidoglycan/LPS O-acetylase OafA/YrhL
MRWHAHDVGLGFAAYLVPVAIVWFFVVSDERPQSSPFAFWLVGASWALLTSLLLSYAEGERMNARALIISGSCLIVVGVLAAGLMLAFGSGEIERFIYSNMLLFVASGVGANFLATGLIERGRGRTVGDPDADRE